MKPNIFDIATTELSQDGFFTWFIQWSDENNKEYDTDLNNISISFVKMLIHKQKPDYNKDIKIVRAGRQWEKIDIYAEVNNEILIIIEDKTNTKRHSNQLENYKNKALKWCEDNKCDLICIYLKTGSESKKSLKVIEEKGYSVVDRNDILNILEKAKNIKNEIFKDFKENLRKIEDDENKFDTIKIGDWDWSSWIGFYRLLENYFDNITWDYVPNQTGGFLCAVLNWGYNWNDFPVFMQIEQGKLCFKIGEVYSNRREIRNKWHNFIISSARNKNINEIVKPRRFGNGLYMTVAIIEKSIWLGDKETIINKDRVIENLQKYLNFFKECVDKANTKENL